MSGCKHGKNPLHCGICTPPEKYERLLALQEGTACRICQGTGQMRPLSWPWVSAVRRGEER